MINSSLAESVKSGLETDFERSLFDSAMANLANVDNPLRFNNFAYATRELTRHVLKRMAPDDEVRSCSWYREETGNARGVSRRQRAVYAVQGGLDDKYVQEVLGIDLAEMNAGLRDAIENLSKHTHIEDKTFGLSSERADEMVDEALDAINEVFSSIDRCRRAVADALQEHVDKEVINQVLSETILEIDELASHHFIDEVYTDEIDVTRIDSQFIHIVAQGSVECELQWGSNSDLKRGDGVVVPESFPFQCELKSAVESPGDFEPDLTTFVVDTSSWRDMDGPDDEN